MIYYLNGRFSSKYLENERTLIITLSDERGTKLLENLRYIIGEYKKHMTCISIVGTSSDPYEYKNILSTISNEGIKICIDANQEPSGISQENLRLADYVKYNGKTYIKDYSPFGDDDVWIDKDLTNN